ncbi:murein DD-endopeptidase MepM [Candidatus Symbiopectobacterium sp. NZEC135]|uniref:murein DD-endopeptidase MepM n=1 Tax=Candidatus Symbiopectobacterium sp. NZEC135 TaxID=2820471 RepID=UPI0022274E04|nr:murein DD-endopeptidase MepM [Candidatus Symbiopectobacterium sp. NZEC135]MCW2479141.1 murein DD-endopeptidase MepM [Candidatus Symbiopectobacterium sp. NZEC135]
MQQIVRTIAIAYNNLPRPHRIMLGSLSVITLAIAAWRPVVYPPANDTPVTVKEAPISTAPTPTQTVIQQQTLAPDASEPMESENIEQPTPPVEIPADELGTTGSDDSSVHEYVISTGDTLSSILTQYGIDMVDVSLLADKHDDLRNLKVGQQLSWAVNDDGELQSLTWQMSRRETRIYERGDNGFKERIEMQKGEWHNRVINGRLSGSFVQSAKAAGLTDSEVSAVIKALQWQLDFRKLRKDDNFSVLLSREILDGRSEQSELIGVRLNTGDKDYFAIRAADGKFYDREGSGLTRGFMRFPTMKQFRVSSNFNPRRLNPVTGRVTPHRGVDFSMPVGTPVLSVGDGEVVAASRGPDTGNFVEIRHGRQYTTRYMHLNRLLVKPGQKVKRGDRIALSGNTGRSTGPHLHYEFWINQQAVNPLTAKLPRSEGLAGQDRREYLAQVREVTPQLKFD